jgi:hypothetical protein
MKIAKAMLGGLVLAATPFLATAADNAMSYRYLQAGYVETDVDVFGETLSGFNVGGSFGFAENFFVFGEFESTEISEGGVSLEMDQMVVGLGGHYPLGENIDLVGRIGAAELDLELDSGGGSISGDESGYLVAAGLRGQAGDSVELEFAVVHQDLGNDLSDTGFEAAARYHFNSDWAAGIEYQDVGDFSSIFAGVRYSLAP